MTADAPSEIFQREGWLRIPRLVGAQTLDSLRRATAALESVAAEFEHDTTLCGVDFEVQSASGRKGERAVAPGALRKITFPSKGQAAFMRLRRDERVTAVLEEIGLRSPVCLVDQVNFKLPRVGTGFPFHQDASFLISKTRERIDRDGGANLVLALDAADAGNGGFEVLGRTHRGGLVEFAYDTSGMNEGVFDETHRAVVALEPGDAVLFHPGLAHGSGPNRSDRPRRMATLWFVGAPAATG